MLRRLRVFTLIAAGPVLERVNHPACHAAAEVGWRVAERLASDEEIAAAEKQLRAAWEESMEAANHYFGDRKGGTEKDRKGDASIYFASLGTEKGTHQFISPL
jgi:hypothetical protein